MESAAQTLGRLAAVEGFDPATINLAGANMQRAALAGTHLERANLKGAHLEGANLMDAHLKGASSSRRIWRGRTLEGRI